MGKMIAGKTYAVTFLSLVLPFALVMVAGCAAPTGTTVPDGSDPDEGGGTETDAGDAGVTVEFPADDAPEIAFSGVVSEVVRPGALVVSVDGSFTGHAWYLNGSGDHVGLTTDGATATIDTGAIARGTHAVSVIVAEGFSGRFSFVVVDVAAE